jgi:hypothetical protein
MSKEIYLPWPERPLLHPDQECALGVLPPREPSLRDISLTLHFRPLPNFLARPGQRWRARRPMRLTMASTPPEAS